MEKWDGSHTMFCGTNGEEQNKTICKLWKVPNEILHKQINNEDEKSRAQWRIKGTAICLRS